MRLIDALLGEHGAQHVLIDKVDAMVSSAKSMDEIQCAIAILSAVLGAHSRLEDDLLEPALERHLGKTGPIAGMRAEHDEIRRALQKIEGTKKLDEGADRVALLLDLVRNHFQKEEAVLFRIADQLLSEQTQIQLGTAWAKERGIKILQTDST
jgi:hemerythrin-like domain-containing protein